MMLMTRFYGELKERAGHEAIRAAQLSLLATEDYRHPVYWAGFNLVGDPR